MRLSNSAVRFAICLCVLAIILGASGTAGADAAPVHATLLGMQWHYWGMNQQTFAWDWLGQMPSWLPLAQSDELLKAAHPCPPYQWIFRGLYDLNARMYVEWDSVAQRHFC